VLLFRSGNFLQVLEGKKETVLALYEKIVRDPRHTRRKTLFQGNSIQRDFPDWSMGFHDLSSPNTKNVPGFSHFLKHIVAEQAVDIRALKAVVAKKW
jgi:hypothetical protein